MAEVEAEYVWGLLDPALLNGEVRCRRLKRPASSLEATVFTAFSFLFSSLFKGGYYLTSLSSASHWLKNYSVQSNARLRVPCMDDVQGVLKLHYVMLFSSLRTFTLHPRSGLVSSPS